MSITIEKQTTSMKWYIVRAQSNRERSVSERIMKEAEKPQTQGMDTIMNKDISTQEQNFKKRLEEKRRKTLLSTSDITEQIDTIKNKRYSNILNALKIGIKDQKSAERLALELQQPNKDLWIWVNGPSSINPALSGYVAGVLKYTVRNVPIYKPK